MGPQARPHHPPQVKDTQVRKVAILKQLAAVHLGGDVRRVHAKATVDKEGLPHKQCCVPCPRPWFWTLGLWNTPGHRREIKAMQIPKVLGPARPAKHEETRAKKCAAVT